MAMADGYVILFIVVIWVVKIMCKLIVQKKKQIDRHDLGPIILTAPSERQLDAVVSMLMARNDEIVKLHVEEKMDRSLFLTVFVAN